MADGGPVDTGERGTSPNDRGTSVVPHRNTGQPDANLLDAAAPSDAGAPKRRPPDEGATGTLPRLSSSFVAKFEKLKHEYAEEQRESYVDSLINPTPRQLAVARKAGADQQAKALRDLTDLGPYDLIGPATALANEWIGIALEEIKRRKPVAMVSDCLSSALAKHFAAESEDDIAIATKAIVDKLAALRDGEKGLNSSAAEYECDGARCWGTAAGYTILSSASTLCPAMLKQAFDGYRANPKSYEVLTITLMHEGLHRVALGHFWHPTGETYADSDDYRTLDLRSHLVEADSYVHFAKDLAACLKGSTGG